MDIQNVNVWFTILKSCKTSIRKKIGVVLILEKMLKSYFRWFGHVWRKLVKALVRRVDQMEGSLIARDRGRSKKTIYETIKKDLDVNNLNMIYT